MDYKGKVNGIDAQATEGLVSRCQAFINADANNYIQVETSFHSLQTVLELACHLDANVEVTYDELNGSKILRRIRVLDR